MGIVIFVWMVTWNYEQTLITSGFFKTDRQSNKQTNKQTNRQVQPCKLNFKRFFPVFLWYLFKVKNDDIFLIFNPIKG